MPIIGFTSRPRSTTAMVIPAIEISRHRNMPNTSCAKSRSGREAKRRISSIGNIFRRSSSATSKTSTTTGGTSKGNASFHSHGTDVTADSSSAGSSSSVVSSSVPPAATPTLVRGDISNISDRRTTASTSDHAATIGNNVKTRPRRSSLKKTSSYGPETSCSLRKTSDIIDDAVSHKPEQTRPKPKRAALANTNKRRSSLSRRRSTTDIPSSSAESKVLHHSSSSSASLNRRQSVQFDSCVSFATVPTIDDLIEVGACETDLYYTDEEFANMKRAIREDARQIKEDRMNSLGDVIPHIEPHQQSQNEDDLNDWGIEHHTSTKAARAARAHRVNYVIQSVLREQETQCIDPENGLLTDVSVLCLARTSAMASQAARVQAQRRGSDVERHCRRWSATATTNTAANTTASDNDNDIGRPTGKEKGQQQRPRRSSYEDILPSNGVFEENENNRSDVLDSDVLSVADASLDESAPRRRSYTARRRRSCE